VKKASRFILVESNSLVSRGLWEYCSISFLPTLPKARFRKNDEVRHEATNVFDAVYVGIEVNKTGSVDKR